MGQDTSQEASGDVAVDPMREKREVRRVRERIKTFHNRATLQADTDDVCTTLKASWYKEKARVTATWKNLSDPARRALVMNIREKVVSRAIVLHSIIAPRKASAMAKHRATRKLMERVAFELFDIGVVYDAEGLPALVEKVFTQKGGGEEIPFGLVHDVNQTFDKAAGKKRTWSTNSLGNTSLGAHECADLNSSASNTPPVPEINSDPKSATNEAMGWTTATSNNGVRLSMSSNSLQTGYFATEDQEKTARRNPGSRTILNLLSFVPLDAMSTQLRKELTLELLMEMRHAILVHFAILIFSELFDSAETVKYRYEYDSDSDTDAGYSGTDVDEEDNDDDKDDKVEGEAQRLNKVGQQNNVANKQK